jgi:hypothetical protein
MDQAVLSPDSLLMKHNVWQVADFMRKACKGGRVRLECMHQRARCCQFFCVNADIRAEIKGYIPRAQGCKPQIEFSLNDGSVSQTQFPRCGTPDVAAQPFGLMQKRSDQR